MLVLWYWKGILYVDQNCSGEKGGKYILRMYFKGLFTVVPTLGITKPSSVCLSKMHT